MEQEWEFFFGSGAVGYFLEEDRPDKDGEYAYEPYRGPGHYDMQVALRSGKQAECWYKVGEERVVFTVLECAPGMERLRLADFRRLPEQEAQE
jgi:hypothetical protein